MARRQAVRGGACLAILSQLWGCGGAPGQASLRATSSEASAVRTVSVEIDAARSQGPLGRPWRYFGADEPNYATTANGRQLLRDIGALDPGRMYFRTHNLLTSGDGMPSLKWGSTNAYTEDDQGQPVYDWSTVDSILQAGLDHGVLPLVEIGFMPEALSASPVPYRHNWPDKFWTGWTHPPKDYQRWEELVYQWAKHSVQRFGADQVSKWWWQTWNEPNIGYFSGTAAEFYRLNDHAVAGLRRAIPTARVGGPHTAGDGGKFMEGFLEHALRGTNFATGQVGTPLDYLAFHAKGKPERRGGHLTMGLAHQLETIDKALRRFGRYPELAGKPVIVGESDPEGCAACTGPDYSYRNGTMYSSYTAAAFARKLMLAKRHGFELEGAVTWAFTFDGFAPFAGFRQVASNGLTLPVFNVFRMFAKLGAQQVFAQSSGQTPLDEVLELGVRQQADVGVLASGDPHMVAAMVWHYHDDDLPGPEALIQIHLGGLDADAESALLERYLVDETHSNAYSTWLRFGAPATPNAQQWETLQEQSQLALAEPSHRVAVNAGQVDLQWALERQGVTLFVLRDIQ